MYVVDESPFIALVVSMVLPIEPVELSLVDRGPFRSVIKKLGMFMFFNGTECRIDDRGPDGLENRAIMTSVAFGVEDVRPERIRSTLHSPTPSPRRLRPSSRRGIRRRDGA